MIFSTLDPLERGRIYDKYHAIDRVVSEILSINREVQESGD